MWSMSQLDIEKTLSKVIEKVTHDHSVDQATMEKRCQALLILGEEFLKLGAPVDVGLSDIKSKFADQMRGQTGRDAKGEEAKSAPTA